MEWSEVDQEVAGSAADDARAKRARRSAQPSNKEGLEDPTLETPLKDTGLPPSPPIDVRTLSDPEAWTHWLRRMDKLAQLQGLLLYTPEALDLEEFRKGMGKSGGARVEGASDKHPRFDVPAMRAEYDKKMSEMKAKRAEYRARPEVKAKKNEYNKQYYARPEVKAKRARPEVKEKRARTKKQYYARPEVKAKRAEYDRKRYMAMSEEEKAKRAEYMKQYNTMPEVKAKKAECDRKRYMAMSEEEKAQRAEYMLQYRARPEVKAKKAECDKKRRYMARPEEEKAQRAEYMLQYRARPEVKAKKREYDKQNYARPEVKAKRARPEVKEKRAEYDKKRYYMARREYKSKVAEYKSKVAEFDQMVAEYKSKVAEFDQMVAEYMARPEVKAKRATEDAAEQAETSTLRGKTYWDTLYEVIKLEDLPLPMQCPQHCQAGRRAKPHQYLSKPFHCGCCVGTCEHLFCRAVANGLRPLRRTWAWPSPPIPSWLASEELPHPAGGAA